MRCAICDRALSEPRYNANHKDYDPCDTCIIVIHDILSGYKDKPSAEEDDLPDGPLGLEPSYSPFDNDNEE